MAIIDSKSKSSLRKLPEP